MGTNYYLHEKPPCECCKREYPELHIGKSRGGWCFTLHVDPELGINDLSDWEARWSSPSSYIKDEYDQFVSWQEMVEIIVNRGSVGEVCAMPSSFVLANQAMNGPRGLLRHRLDDFCVKHGSGTWDCCMGYFS